MVCFPGDFSPFKHPSGAFFSLRCLIYKVHAVPGGTLLLYSTSSRLSRTFSRSFLTSDPFSYQQQLFKFTTFTKLCQELFSKFLAFGFRVRRGNFFMLPHLAVAVKYFFHFLSAAVLTAATAWLEYHAPPHLSTPFSKFFNSWILFCL